MILFKLADREEMHKILDVLELGQIGRQTTELAAFDHPKMLPFNWVIMEKMVLTVFLGCILT